MDCIYIAPLYKALYNLCLSFTHSHTHSHTNGDWLPCKVPTNRYLLVRTQTAPGEHNDVEVTGGTWAPHCTPHNFIKREDNPKLFLDCSLDGNKRITQYRWPASVTESIHFVHELSCITMQLPSITMLLPSITIVAAFCLGKTEKEMHRAEVKCGSYSCMWNLKGRSVKVGSVVS